jgi:WD40 repeat protein
LVSANLDDTVDVWDFDRGQRILALTGASRRFVSAAWSLDGRYVVAVGSDGTTTIWDAGVEFPGPGPKPLNSP